MGLGQRLTHSIASSFERHCQIQKPAMSSFVSLKGPSTTERLSPKKRTRAPFELGCRPSPASMIPAFTNSSLYLPMALRSASLGRTPASESLVARTITMKRIVVASRISFWDPPRRSDQIRPHRNVERARAKSTHHGPLAHLAD